MFYEKFPHQCAGIGSCACIKLQGAVATAPGVFQMKTEIHGHVQHPRGYAEEKKYEHERPKGRYGQPGNKRNETAIEECSTNGHAAASIPDDQPTGEWHSEQRTERRGKEYEAYDPIIDVELILNARQAREIVRVNKTVEEENDIDSKAGG